MAYTPIHAWKRKDTLLPGDPQKIIYGEQLQDEFDAISKGLSGSGGQGGGESNPGGDYDDTQIKADLAAETQSRISGDANLQTQINNLPSGGGGASSWDELTGKPEKFPPEAHTQGWDTITGTPEKFTPADHGHEEIAKDAAYIKYEDDTWKASPSMEVDGNLSVSGLEVSGNIDANGSISVDGDLAITGKIEGDLTVNGNITIDGGQIVDPDGNPAADTNIPILDAPPESPEPGEQWFSNADGYLYIWYGAEWVAIGGTA